MHYVYVLKSVTDANFYVGRTTDLVKRFSDHTKGKVPSTRERRPLRLVYYEACNHVQDAAHRERYLKSAWGKRYLKHRLKHDAT
ncbi:MAG: GIY-YIG nuclease family protein [Candidatus Jorgensenbacteria bacterium]